MTYQETLPMMTQFITYALELPVLQWDGSLASLTTFSSAHCLLPEAQPMLAPETLQSLLLNAHSETLYEIHDPLGIHLHFFTFQKQYYLIGPYVSSEWNDQTAEQLLARLNFPLEWFVPYKIYYCTYPTLSTLQVQRTISAALATCFPSELPLTPQLLTGLQGKAVKEIVYHDEPVDFSIAEKIYEIEDEMLQMVSEGHPEAALAAYKRIQKVPKSKLYRVQSVQASLEGGAVMRTLLRRAACQGGAHPAVVDAITYSYAQRMQAGRSVTEIIRLFPEMIVELANTVKNSRYSHYSVPIRRVVDYISLHFSQEMTRTSLAKLSGLSESHLSHLFHEETGKKLTEYISDTRCEKAYDLLLSTDLSIQEISSLVGYLDNNYFARIFRAKYHKTPSQVRRSRTGADT